MATSLKTEVKNALKAADALVKAISEERRAYKGTEIEKTLTYFISKMNAIKAAADNNYAAITTMEFQTWKADMNGIVNKVQKLLFPPSDEPKYWTGTPVEVAFNDFRMYAGNVEFDLKNASENYKTFEKDEIEAQAHEVVDDIVREKHSDVMKYLRTDHLKAGEKKFIAMTDKTSLKFNLALLSDMMFDTDTTTMSNEEINMFNEMSDILKTCKARVDKFFEGEDPDGVLFDKKGTASVKALIEIKQKLEMIQQNGMDILKEHCNKFDSMKVVLANTCATLADYVKAGPKAYINLKSSPDAQSRAFSDAVLTEGFNRAKKYEKKAAKTQEWHDKAMEEHNKKKAAEKATRTKNAEAQAKQQAARNAFNTIKEQNRSINKICLSLRQTNASIFTKQSKQFARLTDFADYLVGALNKGSMREIDVDYVAEAIFYVRAAKHSYDVHCKKHPKSLTNTVRNNRMTLANDLMDMVDRLADNSKFREACINFENEMRIKHPEIVLPAHPAQPAQITVNF